MVDIYTKFTNYIVFQLYFGQALTPKHIKMLEYMGDLKDYYYSSYGNKKLNEKLPCNLVKDLVNKMNNVDEQPRVTGYFTHSTTLFLVLTSLGVFEDKTPLRADNFAAQQNRLFYGHDMCPFSANFAAIRYQCSEVDKDESEKVLFLLNQKPLAMKWCKNGAVCTFRELKHMYEKSPMSNCTHKMCESGAKKTHQQKKIGTSGANQFGLSILMVCVWTVVSVLY